MEYEFTLKFRLPAEAAEADELLERLGEAGCDDALVGVGRPGRIALDFTREAGSALAAISSAMGDARRAIPGAQLVEAGPDLVGLTEVAEIVGISRQAMRKFMLSNPDDFPAPVHEGSGVLWHLSDLMHWFKERQPGRYDPNVHEVSKAAMLLNLARELRQLEGGLTGELQALLA